MAKILLGIALAVMLATAALGFLAKGNADKLQTTLKDKTTALTSAQSKLVLAEGNLKKAQDELTAANTKVADQEKELATQKAQVDTLTKSIEDAKKEMDAKNTEVDDLKKKIVSMGPTNANTPAGDKDPVLEAMKAELAKAQAEAAESKALIDSLTQKKQEVEHKVADLEQYKKLRDAGLMRQGTSGRVLAVNGGWNFVVLSIGDKQGAVMNATLLVTRNGDPIAKVRITSVEPSTCIADIIPGSVRKGVTVQPGDTVVFEGARAGVGAAPASAAGGGAPVLPIR